jgi:hypothetical protein
MCGHLTVPSLQPADFIHFVAYQIREAAPREAHLSFLLAVMERSDRSERKNDKGLLSSEPDGRRVGDGSRRNGAIRGFLLVSLTGAEPARQDERGGERGSGEREVESRVEWFCEWQG